MKRIFICLLAGVTQQKAFAATITAAVAGITATSAGLDPWPWVVGAFGAAVVYVKRAATTRLDALVNAGISVLAGGLLAPLAAQAVAIYLHPKLASDVAMALLLSCLWPWLLPAALKKLQEKTNAI